MLNQTVIIPGYIMLQKLKTLAVEEGFEPTKPVKALVFKTSAIVHYATPPSVSRSTTVVFSPSPAIIASPLES